MRKLYIFGFIGIAVLIIGIAWAEQITLSTYYPAPYGVYRQFTTTSKTCIATNTLGTGADEDAEAMVGIGTTDPGTNKLEIVGGTTKTTGGLIIETRDATDGDPTSPEDGRMWLRTDITTP